MITLAPSILAADFTRLGEQVHDTVLEGIRYLHIDVMDGMFVPSISFGFPVIETLRPFTDQIFDVHLMICEPLRFISRFAKAGADHITVHFEACGNPAETLLAIRENGCGVGLSINPSTPVDVVFPYLELVDLVLIMTVEPGFGGQEFLDFTVDKIRTLRNYCRDHGLHTVIETDGGLKADNLHVVMEAGCDRIVCGSAVFHGDIRGNVRSLRREITRFEEAHQS